jgi:hypothetical protein
MMLRDQDLVDIRVVLEAQRDLVRRLDAHIANPGMAFVESEQHANDLATLSWAA